jgi:hypothetical protein
MCNRAEGPDGDPLDSCSSIPPLYCAARSETLALLRSPKQKHINYNFAMSAHNLAWWLQYLAVNAPKMSVNN